MKHWLDRGLIVSPIYYCLITSERLFKSEVKRMKLPSDLLGIPSGKGACTHFFEAPTGLSCALVCLFDKKYALEQIYSLLAHEAVHIWQAICNDIGEKDPSQEFEAYSIQRITQNLIYEYKRQNKRRLRQK